jgi:hypothetical protein
MSDRTKKDALSEIAACVALALGLALPACAAAADDSSARTLPFLGEEARKRGYELPEPFGVGIVYYKLKRDIEVTDVRVGRGDSPPTSVSHFVDFGSSSDVDNVNVKVDAFLFPFLNLYAIAGKIKNTSNTNIEVTLPPLVPGGAGRTLQTTVQTKLDGTVKGVGMTLAGGVGPFFGALDVNKAKADIGFDEKFKATVASARAGWNGTIGGRPLRTWVNVTYWDTFAVAKGTVPNPDGGTLTFAVEQGPRKPWTYGLGMQYAPAKWFDLAVDTGIDGHGGWYVALVPAIRF